MTLDGASGETPAEGTCAPPGSCVFRPMLEIGPCDHVDQLRPLTMALQLTADSSMPLLRQDEPMSAALMAGVGEAAPPVEEAWADTDESDEEART